MNQSLKKTPSLSRQLAAILYDLFLLLAIILAAVSVVTVGIDLITSQGFSTQLLEQQPWKFIYQTYLFIVGAGFYIFFWVRGGQTLGMKVWKMQLVSFDGQTPDWSQALLRLILALVFNSAFGIGLLSRLFNADDLTIYDRLSATRLVHKDHIEE